MEARDKWRTAVGPSSFPEPTILKLGGGGGGSGDENAVGQNAFAHG